MDCFIGGLLRPGDEDLNEGIVVDCFDVTVSFFLEVFEGIHGGELCEVFWNYDTTLATLPRTIRSLGSCSGTWSSETPDIPFV